MLCKAVLLPQYYDALHQHASPNGESVTSVARMKKALRVRLCEDSCFRRRPRRLCDSENGILRVYLPCRRFSSGIQVLMMKSKLLSHCGLLCTICSFMLFCVCKDVVFLLFCFKFYFVLSCLMMLENKVMLL